MNMDPNLNVCQAAEGDRGYFAKKITTLHKISVWTKGLCWEDAVDQLGADIPEPGVIEKMRFLHIAEEDWSKYSEEEDVADAIGFWKWVEDILVVGGKYVEELTVELVNCEDSMILKAVHPIKIKFLENLPRACENAKAIRLIGDGLYFGNRKDREAFGAMGRKGGFSKLEAAEIGFEMTDSHMGQYLNDKILALSPLKVLTICSEQFQFVNENQVFSNVGSLNLGNFGAEYNSQKDFVDLVAQLFPKVEALRLFNCYSDSVYNLPSFVNKFCSKIPLKTFGADQSFATFLGEGNEKINSVETVELDVRGYRDPSMDFLHQVADCEQVVITGYKSEGLEQFRERVISFSQTQFVSCKKISLEDFQGSVEQVVINSI